VFLLDTNVLSEATRPRPEPRVLAWMRRAVPDTLFVSALTVGELIKGLHQLERRSAGRALHLRTWLDGLRADYADRVLPIDTAIAEAWGRLAAVRPRPVVDGLLAATALVHDLTLVTRNARVIADAGVRVLDPWTG
jgi:predicted nucleic acid-binding protein